MIYKRLLQNRIHRVSILLLCLGMNVSKNHELFAQQNCGANYKIPEYKLPHDYSKIVYIDPTYTGTETGSITEPFNSWNDITVEENTAYLIKAGTTIENGLSVTLNNNYIGKYGIGERPVIQQYLSVFGSQGVFDSLNIISYGNSQNQKIVDLANVTNVTIANSYITGLVGSYDYPYTLVKGRGEHVTFYNNIMSGAKEDGMYIGSSPYFTFVRNWLYNTNMGGIDVAYGGDGIQFEYDSYYNAYIAGNIIDRSNTMSKFCLIVNAEDLTHDFVCEWNTFIAPKNGNGGAAVRWLGGANNKFNKNLIITYQIDDTLSHKISGIASYDVSANQEEPYGIRDNHFYGLGNMFYGLSSYDPTNIGFASAEEYATYLAENGIERYGSNIDTSNFWNVASCENSTPIEEIDQNVFTVFPNPATEVLHISNKNNFSGTCLLQLVSISGELILEKEVQMSSYKTVTVSLENSKPGLYFLTLQKPLSGLVYAQQVVVE